MVSNLSLTTSSSFKEDLYVHNDSFGWLNVENASEDAFVPYSQRIESYLMPIIFGFIFVIGVFGNITLIYVICVTRKLRNAPNIFIVSLAIGDLLVVSLSMPIVSSIYVFESWPFGIVFCKCCLFIRNLSIGVTVFTLTVLSFDRYSAIVTPFKRVINDKNISTGFFALLIWMTSILLSLPDAYTAKVEELAVGVNKSISVCTPFNQDMRQNHIVYVQMNVLVKFLIFYLIPLLVIAALYLMIAKSLLESINTVPVTKDDRKRSTRSRRKVAKIVLYFVIIFTICFLPNHIFMLWFYFNPYSYEQYNDFWNILRMVGFTLCFANSCVNPIALYCISDEFRMYYDRHVFKWCRNMKKSNRAKYHYNATSHRFNGSPVPHTDTIIMSTYHWDSYMNRTSV